MNHLKSTVEINQNDGNQFGIQLEGPLSKDMPGKSLHMKPIGENLDAVMLGARMPPER